MDSYPSELFPRLLAGIHIQLLTKQIESTAFLHIDDEVIQNFLTSKLVVVYDFKFLLLLFPIFKSLNIKLSIEEKQTPLTIIPIAVRCVEMDHTG